MHKLEKTFANCGHLLRCVAAPLPTGSFQAQVEVVRYADNVTVLEKPWYLLLFLKVLKKQSNAHAIGQ